MTLVLKELPVGISHPKLDRRLPSSKKFQDLSGQKFGDWTVVQFAGFIDSYSAWIVKCDCSVVRIVRQNQLWKRSSCSHKGPVPAFFHRVFKQKPNTWKSAREMFTFFGNRKDKFLIARDDSKPIGPNNFRWVKCIGTRVYEFNGIRGNLQVWAERCGVTRERMRQRLNEYEKGNCTLEYALTTKRIASGQISEKRKASAARRSLASQESRKIAFEDAFMISIDSIEPGEVYYGESDSSKMYFQLKALASDLKMEATTRQLANRWLVQFTKVKKEE